MQPSKTIPTCEGIDKYVVDFETYYEDKDADDKGDKCSVTALGNVAYAEHPRFDAYLVSIVGLNPDLTRNGFEFVGHPKDAPWDVLDGKQWFSHNAAFDMAVYAAVKKRHGLKPEPSRWDDTAAMAVYFKLPRSLGQAVEQGLNIKISKAVRSKADSKTVEDMKAEGWWDDMVKYALDDSIYAADLISKFYPDWPQAERDVSYLTCLQANHGLLINKDMLERGIGVLEGVLWGAEQEIPWVADGKKPLSPNALSEQCKKETYRRRSSWETHRRIEIYLNGIDISEQDFLEEDGYPKRPAYIKPPEKFGVRAIEEWIEWNGASYFSFDPMEFKNDPTRFGLALNQHNVDLRAGWLFRCATQYARSKGINVPSIDLCEIDIPDEKNAPKAVVPPKSLSKDKPYLDEWLEEWGEEFPWVDAMKRWQKANTLLQKLYIFKKRLDSRGRLAYGFKYGAAHTLRWGGDGGTNVQALHKDEVEGVNLRHMIVAPPGKKLAVWDYDQIEARILLYLAGDEKQLDLIRQGLSPYESHAVRTMGWDPDKGKLKDKNPAMYALAKARVLGLGYQCAEHSFVRAAWSMARVEVNLKEAKTIVNDFRSTNQGIVKLWNRLHADCKIAAMRKQNLDVELPSGRVMTYWNPIVKGKQMLVQLEKGAAHRSLYGGKMTENLVQAVARDVLVDGLLRLHDAGFPWLFHVHDECIHEVPEDTTAEEMNAIICQTPDWLEGCPIGASTIFSQHYFKG